MKWNRNIRNGDPICYVQPILVRDEDYIPVFVVIKLLLHVEILRVSRKNQALRNVCLLAKSVTV